MARSDMHGHRTAYRSITMFTKSTMSTKNL